jgi:hypothetical protein
LSWLGLEWQQSVTFFGGTSSMIEFLVMVPVIIVAWLIMLMIVVLSLAAIVGMFRGK